VTATGLVPSTTSGAAAPEVVVAGLVRMSKCDWPGHLVATVFLQGCPWRCGYCHNPDLIDPRAPGVLAWSEVLAFLDRRRGLLDGVVFTGGEPTLDAALPAAIADVRARGFAVGLHTGGAYPRRLEALLAHLDWVGLDIKALPEDYPEVVGRPGSGERAWRSLAIVLASGVDHEIRTTVHPGSPAAAHLPEIAGRLRAAGVRSFVLQQARALGTRPGFVADAAGWDAEVQALADAARAAGPDRVTLRRAS
jgi:pyruvate formate lyase activating enzyme